MDILDFVYFGVLTTVAALVAAITSISRRRATHDTFVHYVPAIDENLLKEMDSIPLLGTFSLHSDQGLVLSLSEHGTRLLESSLPVMPRIRASTVDEHIVNMRLSASTADSASTISDAAGTPLEKPSRPSNRAYFEAAGLHVLFHLTSRSNWPSIMKSRALLSIQRLNSLGIEPSFLTNDTSHSLDETGGLDSYVHLSFAYNNPMFYRLIERSKDSVPDMLVIHLDALDLPNTMFTNANATKKSARPSAFPDIIADADLKRIRSINSGKRVDFRVPENKDSLQSEALVRDEIPLHFVVGRFPYQRQKSK